MHLSYLACFINSILRSAEISALCLQATVQVRCMCTWIQSQWCEWEPRVWWNLGARCVSNVKLWVIMHCLAVVHLVHLEADRLWEVKRESLGFHLIFRYFQKKWPFNMLSPLFYFHMFKVWESVCEWCITYVYVYVVRLTVLTYCHAHEICWMPAATGGKYCI